MLTIKIILIANIILSRQTHQSAVGWDLSKMDHNADGKYR